MLYEEPDQTPVAIPVSKLRKPSQFEEIRRMVREEMSRAAQDEGFETFEEADDFDVGDFDPSSPYEELFDYGDDYGQPGGAVHGAPESAPEAVESGDKSGVEVPVRETAGEGSEKSSG